MKRRGGLSVILGLGPEEHEGHSPPEEHEREPPPEGHDREPPPEEEEEEPDDSEDYEAMASEILDAMHAKDPRAFAEALRGFVESCR